MDKDAYVCGVYVWGEDSPAYNIFNVDIFDVLESDINLYDSLGYVYIVGDFNSRVGSKCDYIMHDRMTDCIDDYDYIPDEPLYRGSPDIIL